ncbi:MAG: ribonuclease P protein component [Lacibacter sp.]
MKLYTLGKTERLKSRKRLEALFKEGKSFTHFPFRVYYVLASEPKTEAHTPPLVFGVGVGTRNFKKAVDRNRIKRLIREAYRLQKQLLVHKLTERGGRMDLFFIFTGKEMPDYSFLFQHMQAVLQKLEQRIDQSYE